MISTNSNAQIRWRGTRLQIGDVVGISSEQLVGDLLTSVIWGYFVTAAFLGGSSKTDAIEYPANSYGIVKAEVVGQRSYGVILRARMTSLVMDINHNRLFGFSKTNDRSRWVANVRARGHQLSALEHQIPELYFSGTTQQRGFSTMSAISQAVKSGQRLYTFTKQNAQHVSALQQSAHVMANVRAALDAGKVVTIHESAVTVGGFAGAGYIVMDPETGSGSFLIEGGAGGDSQEDNKSAMMIFLSMIYSFCDQYPTVCGAITTVADFFGGLISHFLFAIETLANITNGPCDALQNTIVTAMTLLAGYILADLGLSLGVWIFLSLVPLGLSVFVGGAILAVLLAVIYIVVSAELLAAYSNLGFSICAPSYASRRREDDITLAMRS